jgi:hypothetical protein
MALTDIFKSHAATRKPFAHRRSQRQNSRIVANFKFTLMIGIAAALALATASNGAVQAFQMDMSHTQDKLIAKQQQQPPKSEQMSMINVNDENLRKALITGSVEFKNDEFQNEPTTTNFMQNDVPEVKSQGFNDAFKDLKIDDDHIQAGSKLELDDRKLKEALKRLELDVGEFFGGFKDVDFENLTLGELRDLALAKVDKIDIEGWMKKNGLSAGSGSSGNKSGTSPPNNSSNNSGNSSGNSNESNPNLLTLLPSLIPHLRAISVAVVKGIDFRELGNYKINEFKELSFEQGKPHIVNLLAQFDLEGLKAAVEGLKLSLKELGLEKQLSNLFPNLSLQGFDLDTLRKTFIQRLEPLKQKDVDQLKVAGGADLKNSEKLLGDGFKAMSLNENSEKLVHDYLKNFSVDTVNTEELANLITTIILANVEKSGEAKKELEKNHSSPKNDFKEVLRNSQIVSDVEGEKIKNEIQKDIQNDIRKDLKLSQSLHDWEIIEKPGNDEEKALIRVDSAFLDEEWERNGHFFRRGSVVYGVLKTSGKVIKFPFKVLGTVLGGVANLTCTGLECGLGILKSVLRAAGRFLVGVFDLVFSVLKFVMQSAALIALVPIAAVIFAVIQNLNWNRRFYLRRPCPGVEILN